MTLRRTVIPLHVLRLPSFALAFTCSCASLQVERWNKSTNLIVSSHSSINQSISQPVKSLAADCHSSQRTAGPLHHFTLLVLLISFVRAPALFCPAPGHVFSVSAPPFGPQQLEATRWYQCESDEWRR